MQTSENDYLLQSRTRYEAGQLQETLQLLRLGLQNYPQSEELLNFLAHTLGAAGHLPEAIHAWKEIVRRWPERAASRFLLSFYLRQNGQPDEAIQVLSAGAKAYPDQEVRWLREIARVHEDQGDYEQALWNCDQILLQHPNDPVTEADRKRLRTRQRAVQFPDTAQVLAAREELLCALKRGTEYKEQQAAAFLKLADALHEAGNLESAAVLWQEAIKRGGTSTTAKEALERLRNFPPEE